MSTVMDFKPMSHVLHWEAISSLGESAAETALLLRAGIINVTLSRFIDATGQRVKLCSAPAISRDALGPSRLAVLAAHGLRRLLMKLKDDGYADAEETFNLFLALPERFSDDGGNSLNGDGASFVEFLMPSLVPQINRGNVQYFPFGRAGGALALQKAAAQSSHGGIAICGGVDSQHDWGALEALIAADRLLTADNVDGIRPGEGAAFLAVGDAYLLNRKPRVAIYSIGLGREPYPIGSEGQSQGTGLSMALESAMAPLRSVQARTNFWLIDSSHEDYATQEMQNIITRFGDVIGLQTELQMPLRELGDVGAAALPMLISLAAEAWRCGNGIDDVAVAAASSDHGGRGAILFGCV